MNKNKVLYNVVCVECGHVWQPEVESELWGRAKKHSEEGYLDALPVSPQVCGCQEADPCPDAPYRVIGYDDLCRDFAYSFFSLVKAGQIYLKLARESMCTVFFVDARAEAEGRPSRVKDRVEEMAWNY